jgi:hypothetical protein
MDFATTMSLIGVALISIAFGMILQRYFQESDEAEAGRDR